MVLTTFDVGRFKKGWDIPSASVKAHWECTEKEKNILQLWLLTPRVSDHVMLSGGKPQCLCRHMRGASQRPGVTVPWGENEAVTPVGIGNRHMPRRQQGGLA